MNMSETNGMNTKEACKVFETISSLRKTMAPLRHPGKSIGFVPTMGALHEGHRSLLEKSVSENDYTVASIFVNPIQFGPNEDLDKYPRSFDNDVALCNEVGVDFIFHPSPEEMYTEGFSVFVDSEAMTDVMCGRSRPGHFRGVMTVVNKLFNIVQPDRAYFGEKDAQQLAVIKKMVRDMNTPIEIVGCPTVRENDGLAKSSRNTYLSDSDRNSATCLYRALCMGRQLAVSGERDASKIIKTVTDEISVEKSARIDYVDMLDAMTLGKVSNKTTYVLLATSVYFDTTRLIDNVMFEWNGPAG